MFQENLIQKYNIPGPRYTSYPTVPYWEEQSVNNKIWIKSFKDSFNESNTKEGISLYLHLPFCESLCTFCACNKRITKNHSLEKPYIDTVLKEWNLYLKTFKQKPIIKEIHLGGGTPTFFSVESLQKLMNGIYENSIIHSEREFSFEGHPNNTTKEHLQCLYNLGFRRVSFGVQDYDEKVQKAINRIQPFENVKKVTEWSRQIGYESISHDLVFGLPFQSLEAVISTIEKTKSLQPDRLAFYSYAHVPWLKGNGQRGFEDKDLPNGEEKRILYEKGKELLAELGYFEIGMDHFAIESDSMYISMKNNTLHRNFMGYTSSKTKLMIGLGVSSISDSWYAFAQNEKELDTYQNQIQKGELAVFRGHILSEKDLLIRKKILEIMCNLETELDTEFQQLAEYKMIIERIKEFEADSLLQLENNKLIVNELGRPFVRNICMAFDLRMLQKAPETRLFSLTV